MRLLSQANPMRAFARLVRFESTQRTTSIPKEETRLIEIKSPREVVTADVLSGAPAELRSRGVRIYKPTKNSMQSGKYGTSHWRIDFDIVNGESKWENPLMGWASSSDTVQGTHLKFKSKDDAIHFAEKQGWDYFVQEPNEPKFRKKSYSDNYLYSPTKLRYIKTK